MVFPYENLRGVIAVTSVSSVCDFRVEYNSSNFQESVSW